MTHQRFKWILSVTTKEFSVRTLGPVVEILETRLSQLRNDHAKTSVIQMVSLRIPSPYPQVCDGLDVLKDRRVNVKIPLLALGSVFQVLTKQNS